MEIKVNSKKYGKKIILIDDEDYELIKDYTWCVVKDSNTFYSLTHIKTNKYKKKNIFLHRLIMNLKKGEICDHINGNGLDNRKSNLRLCSYQQNNMNRKSWKNSTSKFKGISWNKLAKKWKVTIGKDKKNIHLGYYENEFDAALVYNGAAKYLHGEFAKLNNINGELNV